MRDSLLREEGGWEKSVVVESEGVTPRGTPAATKRVRTKTYAFGVYLVVFLIVLQGVAISTVFWLRQATQFDLDAPQLRQPEPVALPAPLPPSPVPLPVLPPPPAPLAREAAPPSGTPSDLLIPQGGGRLSMALVLNPQERIAALNREAGRFVKEGEYSLARAALLEAENLDERHPLTLQNAAELAEAEGNDVRARLYWARLSELGPEIGEPYAKARARLLARAGAEAQAKEVAERKVLAVERYELVPDLDNDQVQRFQLRIPIGLRTAGRQINAGEVKIKLFFYDESDAGEVVPSQAERRVNWQSAPADWRGGDGVELLVADYALKRTPTARKFYGFVFRLYYMGELQEERAQPLRLLDLITPSETGTKR